MMDEPLYDEDGNELTHDEALVACGVMTARQIQADEKDALSGKDE